MSFTRYLYFLDETLYSLQEAILNAVSFEECVFWCGEIYYSGFQDKLWNFIFEFNYNFCAVTHPKYERKLCKLYSIFITKNCISYILSAITLLFYTKKNYSVFAIWQKNPEYPNKIYVGRTPKWYATFETPPKYKNFVRSLHVKNWVNIIFYIKCLDIDILYDVIKKYFINVVGCVFKDKILSDIPYQDKRHILLALILYLFEDEQNIQKRSVFRAYDHTKYKLELEESKKPVIPAYKTLVHKLKYPVCNTIGCFPLNRYITTITIQNMYWHHWEYYCYNTPLWKSRFDTYDITICHDTKNVIFNDDEEYESFCNAYYYETDEQCKDIQDKNIRHIPRISLETWFENKLK